MRRDVTLGKVAAISWKLSFAGLLLTFYRSTGPAVSGTPLLGTLTQTIELVYGHEIVSTQVPYISQGLVPDVSTVPRVLDALFSGNDNPARSGCATARIRLEKTEVPELSIDQHPSEVQ